MTTVFRTALLLLTLLAGNAAERIPVVIDTDLGGDIDDTWALAMALKMPELDIRLITTGTGDPVYRARLVCRLLEVAKRTDIPVGLGDIYPSDGPREKQKAWIADYPLERYPGTIHRDGVDALVRTCLATPGVTLIGLGPLTTIEAALRREPKLAPHTRLVIMAGCVRRHFRTNIPPAPFPEFNVVQDLPAARVAFAAPWRQLVITPLDSCEQIQLTGTRYQRCAASTDPLMQAVIANYRIWRGRPEGGENASSILFDAAAVWLAATERHLVMEDLRLRLTQDGRTVIHPAGMPARVATGWTGLDAFLDEYTTILTR